MRNLKWLFALSIAIYYTAPACAQVVTDSVHTGLDKQLETAVTRAYVQEELTIQELIEAEEELQTIRNRYNNHASFEAYPYLLNVKYRRGDEKTRLKIRQNFENGKQTGTLQNPSATQPDSTGTEELTPYETIQAEEELQTIRDKYDNHASFDKYPYLLSVQYRRATPQKQAQIRQLFFTSPQPPRESNSLRNRKIGI